MYSRGAAATYTESQNRLCARRGICFSVIFQRTAEALFVLDLFVFQPGPEPGAYAVIAELARLSRFRTYSAEWPSNIVGTLAPSQ